MISRVNEPTYYGSGGIATNPIFEDDSRQARREELVIGLKETLPNE